MVLPHYQPLFKIKVIGFSGYVQETVEQDSEMADRRTVVRYSFLLCRLVYELLLAAFPVPSNKPVGRCYSVDFMHQFGLWFIESTVENISETNENSPCHGNGCGFIHGNDQFADSMV